MPRVTVLMPVFNGAKYLREAIDSIIAQTFHDFEFLIINDGSTDDSVSIINSYTDSRIRLENNESNLGLIATLNYGIDLARGEYVARMDCDDISSPSRLATQVEFMDNNPAVGLCGTWIKVFGDREWINRYPTTHEAISCGLLFATMFAHPTVLWRREPFAHFKLYYDPKYQHAEDYELWTRCARSMRTANIPKPLLRYRLHEQQVSSRKQQEQLATVRNIRKREIIRLGFTPSDTERDLHEKLCRREFRQLSAEQIILAERWLIKLLDGNRRLHCFDNTTFTKLLIDYWYRISYAAKKNGISANPSFWESSLSNYPTAAKKAYYWFKLTTSNLGKSTRTNPT